MYYIRVNSKSYKLTGTVLRMGTTAVSFSVVRGRGKTIEKEIKSCSGSFLIINSMVGSFFKYTITGKTELLRELFFKDSEGYRWEDMIIVEVKRHLKWRSVIKKSKLL